MMVPERIRAPQVACITGLSARSIQEMAQRGDIPGAAKLGKVWTFDEVAVRAWVKSKEQTVCREATVSGQTPARTTVTSNGGTELPMAVSRSTARSAVEAYEQRILRKLAAGSKSGRMR